jgi:hypothetical protein
MTETTLYPLWKQAVKTLLDGGLTFGSTISRKYIADLCGVNPPSSVEDVRRHDLELLTCITEIKDTLLTAHCMLMVTDNKGSYIVIEPESQTTYAVETGVKDISRAMRKMSMNVSFTKTSMLNDAERKRNADAQAKISMLAGMMSNENKELRKIATKEITFTRGSHD